MGEERKDGEMGERKRGTDVRLVGYRLVWYRVIASRYWLCYPVMSTRLFYLDPWSRVWSESGVDWHQAYVL